MITKDHILKKVTEQDLVKYLVKDFDGNIRKNYKSIFSEKDDNPSLSFYLKGDKLMFKSHNTAHQGDVFQLWADYFNIDCKKDFCNVLKKINLELNLGIEDDDKESSMFRADYSSNPKALWAYFHRYGVDEYTLDKFNVRQLLSISFNRNGKCYKFNYVILKKLVVAYLIDDKIKTYIPELPPDFDRGRFSGQKKEFGYKNQTKNDLFGYRQLPKENVPYIIITAGEKDCLVANSQGFVAVSTQSENQIPSKAMINSLRSRAKLLFSCYDNDGSGREGAAKLQDQFDVIPLQLPHDVKDIAEFFLKYNKKDFTSIINQAVSKLNQPKNTSILHRLKEFWESKYEFRFNIIKNRIEMAFIHTNDYTPVTENILSGLWSEAHMVANIKVTPTIVREFLKSPDISREFDPIKDYFNSVSNLRLDPNEDYIQKLSGYVITDNQEDWAIALKKWMVRTVRCALEPEYYNREALVLVDPKQRTGKSSFCRFLCPPSLRKDYMAENLVPGNKDSLIALATNFLINLDELQQFSSTDIRVLKSWLTQSSINIRFPYEKTARQVYRRCSFIGSTNMDEFLCDETGNTRWICFNTNGINHDYNNYVTGRKEVNIDLVWAQAYHLYKEGYRSELTSEEVKQNELRNNRFKALPPEFHLLANYFEPSNSEEGEFKTSTDLVNLIQPLTLIKINSVTMGRAARYHKFERSVNKSYYGYWVKRKIKD